MATTNGGGIKIILLVGQRPTRAGVMKIKFILLVGRRPTRAKKMKNKS
jgi:hypothetical protein